MEHIPISVIMCSHQNRDSLKQYWWMEMARLVWYLIDEEFNA